MQMSELADFLRQRRAGLRPEDVGLYPGPRRRVEGMRREEVAILADMSVNYYTRLEQGKGPQPSPAMLRSIAGALRLDLDERDYLFRLAGHAPPDREPEPAAVTEGLLMIFERFSDTPAVIFTDMMETLVANELAVALFGDETSFTGPERFETYRWFMRPGARELYLPHDRDHQSRQKVANLRAVQGRQGPASPAARLAQVLLRESAEFAELWQRHEVALRFNKHKSLQHPELGRLEVDCHTLFAEEGDQMLMVLTAESGSPTKATLDRLAATVAASGAAHAPRG